MNPYIERVKSCNCVVCHNRLKVKTSPCEAHHVGTGDEHDDHATVALCQEHHRGATGIHGMHRKAFHSFWKTSDIILLAWTNREMNR